jgi:prevent-host-death family protein
LKATRESGIAKTHFPELLDRVVGGERIVITKRGKPVAMLVPIESESEAVAAAVKTMLEHRDANGPRLGKGLTIRKLINEGRRF